MTVSSSYTAGPEAEDITIEKDGGVLKEILVKDHPPHPGPGCDAYKLVLCSGAW